MKSFKRITDSLQNVVSNLGTSKDKASHNQFVFTPIGLNDINAIWRSSWLGRKSVETIPNDMIRQWRTWEAEADQVKKIEKFERKLKIKKKLRKALYYNRAYGGSAIYLGVDTTNPELPLDLENMDSGGLKFLHVFNRHELTEANGSWNTDVQSEHFGQPEIYQLTHVGSNEPLMNIHRSRLIIFDGLEIPDIDRQANDGFGDGIFDVLQDAIKAAASSHAGIASLIQEAKVDVIKIPDLAAQISTLEGAAQISKRFSLANMLKSINNTLVLDGNEDFQTRTFQFSGLTDTMQVFFKVVAAANDMPITRFLNESPGGMNATGESDMRNYYDNIKSIQENDLQPTIERLDEVLLRTLGLYDEDEEITYTWNNLWQTTAKEKAEIAKVLAETTVIYSESGLVDPMVLAETVKVRLSSDDSFPGISQAYAEHDPNLENVNFEAELANENAKLQTQKPGEQKAP